MSFFDDVKKAIADFAQAKARNESANRRFYDAWEKALRKQLLPLLKQTAALFNEQAKTTGLRAEAKPENGSVTFKVAKLGPKHLPAAGILRFQAAQRKIFFTTHVSKTNGSNTETFDLEALDLDLIQVEVVSFITKLLESNAPKP